MSKEKEKRERYSWYHKGVEEVERHFETDSGQGLSAEEAAERINQYGPNEIAGKKRKSSFALFMDNFKQPLIYILVIASAVSFLVGKNLDAAVIFAVAVLNAFISFIQESKAEKAISALAKTMVSQAMAVRDGKKVKIASGQIVPGDLVVLSSGDKIPADMRLIKVKNLQVNESALTGESVPVEKSTGEVDENAVVGDQICMGFAGTLVTAGSARGIVTATGMDTETGRISRMMQESEGLQTPLTRKIHEFSKTLLYIVMALAAMTFALALLKRMHWIEGFQSAVALAVSAIPEGLPAVVTVTLAIGVGRMAKRHSIIRKLSAVETLGSTTVICSDKTGTLTQNKMTVEQIYARENASGVSGDFTKEGKIIQDGVESKVEEGSGLYECLKAGLLCNDSHLEEKDGKYETVGDPTEGALLISSMNAGIERDKAEEENPRLDTIPFESKKQYMATLHRSVSEESSLTVYMKGSLEAVLESCKDSVEEKEAAKIKEEVSKMASGGLRVLAFAKKKITPEKESINDADIESGMNFIGLQGMIDPPRPEAVNAVKMVRKAGIKVKMITGDHEKTAQVIAQKMGIADRKEKVFTGRQLSGMTQEELRIAAGESNVFARVAPEHKLGLVRALQFHGEIVAVTGDGVNDAPALQQADIGVAMGIMGTEVAKEAADMVLTDDNFASIEAAVEEGRTVYSNILKTIGFILPVNGGELLTILAGLAFAAVIPILPVQILWVNMISSVALMLSLSFEPGQKGIMNKPPRDSGEKLLKKSLLVRVAVISLFNVAATFGMFKYIYQTTGDVVLARTIAVNTLVAAETFYLLSISRFIPSVFEYLRERTVKIAYVPALGIICLFVLQYVFTQWAPLNNLFGTQPLSFNQAISCIGAGFLVLIPAFILKKFNPIE